ncbi:MAG: hypothetical protein CO128_07895 [Ignavibacteriales bacterium CG_4_9_14_3_um_filter_30_11]|nr:MAG: hypothetical protein CO128_07895 [Ignavibacteriales bacterium CG_4_9_14_3_um_filter_30_11]
MKTPLVSINILSHNRKNCLKQTLNKVFEQNYKNIEVIVVDNNSNDGSVEMIEKEFNNVEVIYLEKNIGASALNISFKKSKGEYILILDDDSYPIANTIEEGLMSFKQKNNIKIVSFNIFNTNTNRSQTDYFIENELSFIGCGVMIKNDLLKMLNGFSEHYFIYHNELDLSIRTLNLGFKIKYLPNTAVIHDQKGQANIIVSKFRYSNYMKSYLIFFIRNISCKYSCLHIIKWIINRFLICFKYPYFFVFIKSLGYVIVNFNRIYKSKQSIKKKYQKLYLNKIPFVDRDYFPNFKKPSLKLFY